jgi:hypothetical protein
LVFELIYTYMDMSRVWLTSMNIDPKCHSYSHLSNKRAASLIDF